MDKFNIPDFMIISATRYAIGRITGVVSETADWLIANWQEIPASTRNIIRRDVEEAFSRHESGPGGRLLTPLGMECDKKDWERVRKLWGEDV